MRLGEATLAIELADGFVDVALREPNEAQQPVETERGIAAAAADLAILNRRALPQHGFGLREISRVR